MVLLSACFAESPTGQPTISGSSYPTAQGFPWLKFGAGNLARLVTFSDDVSLDGVVPEASYLPQILREAFWAGIWQVSCRISGSWSSAGNWPRIRPKQGFPVACPVAGFYALYSSRKDPWFSRWLRISGLPEPGALAGSEVSHHGPLDYQGADRTLHHAEICIYIYIYTYIHMYRCVCGFPFKRALFWGCL